MLVFLSLILSFAFSAEKRTIHVGINQTESILFPSLERVVQGNGKIAKVRIAEPNEVLITGVRMGETSLRIWNSDEEETEVLIRVIPPHLNEKTKPAQSLRVVKIAIEFIELNSSQAKELGVKFPQFLEMGAHAAFAGGNNFSGIDYSFNLRSAKGVLNAFIHEGKARLVAEPELFVRLGEEAMFHSGGELPISTFSDGYGQRTQKIDWKPFGLTFKVKPESIDGHHISSEIRLELSELNEASVVGGIPSVVRRKVETKIDSLEGETVFLSGLTRQMNSESKKRVPGLSSIPLIGGLFSSTGGHEENTELVITLNLSFSKKSFKHETAL